MKGADVRAQCEALLGALRESPAVTSEHLQTYEQLIARADSESAEQSGGLPADAWQQALADVRAEIESPFFAGADDAEMKARMLEHLAGLNGLAERQQKMAAQGLALLRQRVYRELSARAEREAARQQQAEALRARVGITLQRLDNISRQQLFPASAAEATRLLALLGERLGGEAPAIFAVLDEGNALFTTVQQRLREQMTAAYLQHQVTDVLQTMGYAVTHIAAESPDAPSALVAKVEGDVGLAVEFDGTGGMKTELVALSDHPLMVDEAQQEKVCSLVDRILDSLQQRNCAIRERYRAYMDEDEELRPVEIDGEIAQMGSGMSDLQYRISDDIDDNG